jgi:type I restriction enzyme S subunit
MSEWREVALGDVIQFQRGFDLTEKETEPGPYPVISSGGVSYFTSIPKVDGPGVVTGRKGVLGKVHFSAGPYWPHDTTLWVKDFKGNDPRFVYYWLQAVPLANFDGGAANPTLNRNHAHLIQVRVPDPPLQARIGAILGSIDDLIESDRRRIALLEQMAQAIYREWFVHFRYPGHENVDAHNVVVLGDLAPVVTESVDPLDVDPTTPAVGLENIPRRSFTLTEWGKADELTSRKTSFSAGDVLFGKIRPYFHKVCVAPVDGIASTDAIVVRPAPHASGLVAMTMFSDDFVAHAVATSNGTKMPRASWKVLREWQVPVLPDGVLKAFEAGVSPTISACITLAHRARVLAEIRDLLLPKLVTGAVDVSQLDLEALLGKPAA